jgi:DNA-binding LacI/PurR family transcriptional regulator
MKMCGLSVNEKWMFEGDHKITGGQFAAERIFSMAARPTAIICSNDLTAVGLLQTAACQGRVLPKELSVVGFDGLFFCEIVHPTLTSLQLSREDIASRAFFALQAIREETRPPQASHLLPSLVIRASTGPVGNDSR